MKSLIGLLLRLTLMGILPPLLSAAENEDPFAPLISKVPFASPESKGPFATNATQTPADPFAPTLRPVPADPFAPASPDPFATNATQTPADPFAPTLRPVPADPFAPASPSPFASPTISSVPAHSIAALKEAIQGHFWSWKAPTADTLVVFHPDGTLLTRERRKGRWEPVDGKSIKITHPNQQSLLIRFDDLLTGFSGGEAVSIQGRRENPLPAPPKAIADPSKIHAKDKLVIKPDKIALPEPWIPHNIHSKKAQLEALGSYAEKVLNQGSGTPATIWGPITWLMPLREALATLPRGSYKLRSDRADRLCWPMGISIHFYNLPRGQNIHDQQRLFDEIHFVTDAAERVISVQLSNKQGAGLWDQVADGVMNPYYNFLYDRANAVGGRLVQYQVRRVGSGVSCIKIQCGTERNHWYLSAPLAEMFVEIAQTIRRS